MNLYNSPITERRQQIPFAPNYYSVEFTLNTPYPVYQFKLWHKDHDSIFLLVKESSQVLPQLKVGRVLPMKYYNDDTTRSTEVRRTRIRDIVNETRGRFKGHYRIELAIVKDEKAATLQ